MQPDWPFDHLNIKRPWLGHPFRRPKRPNVDNQRHLTTRHLYNIDTHHNDSSLSVPSCQNTLSILDPCPLAVSNDTRTHLVLVTAFDTMGNFRSEDVPLPFNSSRPLPDRRPTQSRGTLKRGKTLTRPERYVVPAPLIAPPQIESSGSTGDLLPQRTSWDWWVIWSYATTWWAPPVVLKLFGIKEKQSRQAWREKITLCWIALLLGAVVGFATMGLQRALCPGGDYTNTIYQRLGHDDCESA